MMSTPSLFFSFVGGLLSVLSPCVLPIIPIVITGREGDSRWRPLLIIFGLSLTFIAMGILSTLFGQVIAPHVLLLEKIAGVVVIIFGQLFLFNLNPFKKITFFSRINYQEKGVFSGVILGMTLGLIWIPCVGPVLTSILAMVASSPNFSFGVISLVCYSIGFSIPLLIAAYSAHFFREKITLFKKNPKIVQFGSGTILILFGIYILVWGMLGV